MKSVAASNRHNSLTSDLRGGFFYVFTLPVLLRSGRVLFTSSLETGTFCGDFIL